MIAYRACLAFTLATFLLAAGLMGGGDRSGAVVAATLGVVASLIVSCALIFLPLDERDDFFDMASEFVFVMMISAALCGAMDFIIPVVIFAAEVVFLMWWRRSFIR